MNRIKKTTQNIILILLLFSLTIIPSFGSEDNNSEIDLTYMKKEILSNNLEIKRAKEAYAYDHYKKNQAEDKKGSIGNSVIESQKNLNYNIVEADMNLDYSRWLKEQKEQELLLDATGKYYEYLLLEEEIQLEKAKINRLKDNLTDTKKKFELGMGIHYDISVAELAINQAEFTLNTLEDQKKALWLAFNVLMNSNLDISLTLKDEVIPYEDYVVEDMESLITDAILENGELEKLKDEYELMKIEKGIYEKINKYGSYDSNITSIKKAQNQKNYDILDKELSIEYTIRSEYNNLLNAESSLAIIELQIENMELDLESVKKRYEVGLVTQSVVNQSKEQLAFKKLSLDKEKLNYYLSVQQFKNLMEE